MTDPEIAKVSLTAQPIINRYIAGDATLERTIEDCIQIVKAARRKR